MFLPLQRLIIKISSSYSTINPQKQSDPMTSDITRVDQQSLAAFHPVHVLLNKNPMPLLHCAMTI